MKTILMTIIAGFISYSSFSQVGIGTSSPNSSAMLDITSTNQGFLPPRMTGAQRAAIVAPVAGLEIWCTDCGATVPYGEAQIYNGTTWTNLVGGTIKSVTVPGTNTSTGATSPIGIGINTPAASAALDVNSTSKGFLIPRMTSTARNRMEPASTAAGLQVWCSDCNSGAGELSIFNGVQWTTSSGTIANLAPPTDGNAICDGTRPTVVKEVVSTTGRIWMDRNLGANRVAQSNNDNYAYGCLYQWGRGNDGHASINWTSATTGVAVAVASNSLSSSSSPGNSTYYYPTAPVVDWLSSPNNDLWQGLQGVNNPCPDGFRLPTRAEYVAEFTAYSISSSGNNNAIFTNGPGTGFKFTLSSFRYNGALNNININPNDKAGFYWTSTIGPSTSKSYHTYFSPTSVSNLENSRYFGLSVRCIR